MADLPSPSVNDAVVAQAALVAIEAGFYEPPKPTSKESRRVRHDALKAIARDLPNPKKFAWYLRRPWNEWLASAYRSQDPANSGCWKVREEYARDLFAMGLCDKHGYLGAFGNAVRKALLEQGA